MRLTDPARLHESLKKLKAAFVAELREINTYFDTNGGSLKSSDQGLRIRIEQQAGRPDAVAVTHKGPRAHGKLKSRTETEATVHDARDAADLLAALGFGPVLTFEKLRKRYELDGCRIELDSVPYIGDFIEIEGPSEDTVLSVREKLGLDEEPIVKASYIAMLMTYIHEHHITDRVISLEPDEVAAAE